MSDHRLPVDGVPSFDARNFYRALDAIRESRGMTWSQVADESGVSASVFSALAKGQGMLVETLAQLRAWSRLSVDKFFIAPASEVNP